MTFSELYTYIKQSLAAQFPDPQERGIVSRRIIGNLTGSDGNDCLLHPDRRVEVDHTAVNTIIHRIQQNEPLEYVFNSAQFLDIGTLIVLLVFVVYLHEKFGKGVEVPDTHLFFYTRDEIFVGRAEDAQA